MQKIGWIPHINNPIFAGVRYRCFYPIAELSSRGYLAEVYQPQNKADYRVLLVQAKWILDAPDGATRLARIAEILELKQTQGTRIIVDACDNYLFTYRGQKQQAADDLKTFIEQAGSLVTASASLATEFRNAIGGSVQYTVIGDGVETKKNINQKESVHKKLNPKRLQNYLILTRYKQRIAQRKSRGVTNLIWFGNHGSRGVSGGMSDLAKLQSALSTINKRTSVCLTILSNSRQKFDSVFTNWNIELEYLEWNRITSIDIVACNDVALIPISQNAFTLHKSNNRLVLPLSLGLGVIADSIPAYEEFSDFCCLNKWDEMAEYLNDKDARDAKTRRGQRYIEENWTIKKICDQWENLIFES
jgi:hypothetical protein